MKERRIVFAVLALLAAGALAVYLSHGKKAAAAPGAEAAVKPAVIRSIKGNPIRTPEEAIAATPSGILHFCDDLNSSRENARADCQLLVSLLDLYRSLTHTTDPVGDNAEITAVLTGDNRLGYAFIPPGSPAINRAGELCDRWGTPYFFHQISGTQMQVRSAGPDRRHWTSDDVAAGP